MVLLQRDLLIPQSGSLPRIDGHKYHVILVCELDTPCVVSAPQHSTDFGQHKERVSTSSEDWNREVLVRELRC